MNCERCNAEEFDRMDPPYQLHWITVCLCRECGFQAGRIMNGHPKMVELTLLGTELDCLKTALSNTEFLETAKDLTNKILLLHERYLKLYVDCINVTQEFLESGSHND